MISRCIYSYYAAGIRSSPTNIDRLDPLRLRHLPQGHAHADPVIRLYDEYLRPAGLRITQYRFLKNVLAREPVSVNQLAEATVTDRTTLTRNLRVLRQGGLIRIREGEDRRVDTHTWSETAQT